MKDLFNKFKETSSMIMKKAKEVFIDIIDGAKPIDRLTLTFIGVLLFALFGFLLARFGLHNYKVFQVTYEENNDINYKVYLKENNFFEDEYLEENKTYIASLIDYLDIDFKYNIDFSEEVSGSYSYYIKGIITADKSGGNGDNYWTKEYKLSDTVTLEYNDTDTIDINENVKINYQDYNYLLTSFKSEYGLSMDGNLKVVLVVENTINSEIAQRDVLKETNLELNIPLTSLTIEVPIQTDNNTNQGIIIDETIYNNSVIYIIAKVLGYSSYIVSGILIIQLIYMTILEAKKESLYHKKLKKILKMYDGIIVSVKNVPDLSKFNVIKVDTFEELIDAHSEVRRPINFTQKNYGSTFVLLSEGIAWKYFLNRELFIKEENNINKENEVHYEKNN